MKMGLAALREAKMAEGDHDQQKWFENDVVEEVDEGNLERARAVGEDWASGVGGLEILGDGVGLREDDRLVSW